MGGHTALLFCPGWESALSCADPSDIGFLPASSSFKSKARPSQPQPTGEKQVLSRFGHRGPRDGNPCDLSRDESFCFFPRNKLNPDRFPWRRP